MHAATIVMGPHAKRTSERSFISTQAVSSLQR
jgi:hypothetical protein